MAFGAKCPSFTAKDPHFETKEILSAAVYDFDGTVYDGDSVVDFWKFIITRNMKTILFFPFQIITFLLWKLRAITTGRFKEAFLSFLSTVSKSKLDRLVSIFWDKNVKKIYPAVQSQIAQDRKAGIFLICISASPDFLLKNIVYDIGFQHLICTEFTATDKKLNKLKTPNCKGIEKVNRLFDWVHREGITIDITKTVSDSLTDKPLYDISKKKYRAVNGTLISLKDGR